MNFKTPGNLITVSSLQKILLVGGLGSSEYVYDVLNDLFDNRVLRPSDR